MAKKYIDADAFLKKLISKCEEDWCDLMVVYELLNEMPAADVRENVKGEWVHKSEKLAPLNTVWWYECSACGHHAFNEMTTDFCPNCGADMRGEKNEP